MALISTQALTLKSPPTLSLPSHPSSRSFSLTPLNPDNFLCLPKSTARFSARPLVVCRAATSSTSGFSPSIGEVLGEVGIFTAAGDSVTFNDLLDQNEGIAVVALLRHFGCVCCWELASVLKEAKPRFDSAGVKLIAVGVGTPEKARILAERLPFPMDSLYPDPDRKAYDVLGLYFGVARTFLNPASAKVFSRFESLQKALKNYTIKATPDDISSVLQQGGMFVFKGKQLLYARKDKGTENYPRATTTSALDFGPDIGDILGEVSIFTAAGDSIQFKDLWNQKEGVAVVALLRHFGCPCCWELASALKESKERFESAGVKLIAVGVGSPDKARILAERLPFPMDSLYADTERKAKVFSRFDALLKAVKNYTIEATPDDRSSVLQQGGMFVFKGKQLLYARKDEGTGDHASLDDILNVCCKFPVS